MTDKQETKDLIKLLVDTLVSVKGYAYQGKDGVDLAARNQYALQKAIEFLCDI